jgi:hypothetical protein
MTALHTVRERADPVGTRPARPPASAGRPPQSPLTGTWSVSIDRAHPADDNEGRIALAVDGHEVGFVLFIDCADTTVWIDTLRVAPAHRLNGHGTC